MHENIDHFTYDHFASCQREKGTNRFVGENYALGLVNAD